MSENMHEEVISFAMSHVMPQLTFRVKKITIFLRSPLPSHYYYYFKDNAAVERGEKAGKKSEKA